MTQIDQSKVEIERRITDNTFGAKLELIDLLSFIESLEKERVPETEETGAQGLDEAANDYTMNARGGYPRVMDETDRYIYNAFKAGAEWMAGQGVNSEGKVFTSAFTSYVKTPGIEKLLKDAFPEDTEVIVQIRKKQ